MESRRSAVDILLKGVGYLDCAVRHILPQLPPEHRSLRYEMNQLIPPTIRDVTVFSFSLKQLPLKYTMAGICFFNGAIRGTGNSHISCSPHPHLDLCSFCLIHFRSGSFDSTSTSEMIFR
ncbi:hypothetical protein L1987_25379 [Smallanthus sonchifolius]|uniref:Uncharacterized protein n=1 Tax=Smallanthus sonchifolius TaxID=185202 RepID=A0ACB9IMU8_9ASTR|nr:hypothetical protein L1987_25379 [Smallanthus sonchifolius]